MDIESIAKNFTQSLSDGPFNDLFTNPVYVSLLITSVVMLIVILMYNESKLVKTGFYILFSSMCIIFIHNKLLLMDHRKRLSHSETSEICSTFASNIAGGADGLGYLAI